MMLGTAVILVLLVIAAWRDVATRMIPNLISVIVVFVGVAARLSDGWIALAYSAGSALAVFVALLPCHARGLVGGADVKLLSALALGLSPFTSYELMATTAMAGAVLACVYLLLRRIIRATPRKRQPANRPLSVTSRVVAVETWRIRRGAPLPYGLAIAAGAALVLLRQTGV